VVNSKRIKVELPPTYDARVPAPVMIYFHGAGGSEHQFSDAASQKQVMLAALAAGYIVVSASDNIYASGFGADAAIECYPLAYQWARDNFNIGPVVFHVNSMGGIESLITLSQRRIPGVVAWCGTSPTSNLRTAYDNAAFTASIAGAYGIAGDGSDYAAKTTGHDPMLLDGDAFRGLPMMFLHATDDAVIPKATNTDMFKARIAPFALEVIDVGGITGGHSFTVTSTQAAAIIAFFNKYTAV
jgi:acetyl esterase/lipase